MKMKNFFKKAYKRLISFVQKTARYFTVAEIAIINSFFSLTAILGAFVSAIFCSKIIICCILAVSCIIGVFFMAVTISKIEKYSSIYAYKNEEANDL